MGRKLVYGAGFALLFLVAAEGALRLLGPNVTPAIVRTENEGYQFRPHLDSVHWNVESQRLVRLKTNSFGARDADWDLDRRPRPYRIAVIGDSYVAANQIETRARFTDLLQQNLRYAGHDAVVMNFGVDGQEIVNYLDRVIAIKRRFDPDYFVVVIADTADFHHADQTTFRDRMTYRYGVANGHFVETAESFTAGQAMERRAKGLIRELWIAHLVYKAQAVLTTFMTARPGAPGPGACLWPKQAGDEIAAPYVLTAGLMRVAAQTAAGRLVVLQIPADVAQEGAGGKSCDPATPERQFARAAGDLPIIRLAEALADVRHAAFYPQGHLNERGHAIAADALFTYFAKRIGRSP